MSREKQIEEMRKDLCEADEAFCKFCRGRRCQECEYYFARTDCKNQILAEKLTDKGYHKVDSVTFMGGIVEHLRAEVAEEIFAEIDTSLMVESFYGGEVYYAIRAEDYLHYKKKYIGEDTNVTTKTEE